MKKKNVQKHIVAIFATALILILSTICFIPAVLPRDITEGDDVYSSVLRLHIRANSDSEQDQAIKLKVRDRLLGVTSELFSECKNKEDAVNIALIQKELLLNTVTQVLSENGAKPSAEIRIDKEYFPERDYGGDIYPAGEYTALIVELGSGEGQNWWCVLFPSLCLKNVSSSSAIETGFTPEQYREITQAETPRYKLRFRFFEVIEEWFEK